MMQLYSPGTEALAQVGHHQQSAPSSVAQAVAQVPHSLLLPLRACPSSLNMAEPQGCHHLLPSWGLQPVLHRLLCKPMRMSASRYEVTQHRQHRKTMACFKHTLLMIHLQAGSRLLFKPIHKCMSAVKPKGFRKKLREQQAVSRLSPSPHRGRGVHPKDQQ